MEALVRNRSGAHAMVRFVWLPAFAFSISTAAFAQTQPATSTPPQPQQNSVGEAARKAKAKKTETQPGKVYTDEDLAGMRGPVSVVGQTGSGPTSSKKPGESSGKKKKDVASKSEEEQEAYWRGRANAIHEKMAEVDKEMDKVREEIKVSGTSGFDTSSGLKKNVIYVDDRNARLQALEKKKAELDDQLDQLREEGRKAGALPAWFR